MDSSGNAYVTGSTFSFDFPTVNALLPNCTGAEQNAFAAKINASGSALVYSTCLGGAYFDLDAPGFDEGLSIAVDSAGNAYVTGATSSSNFPTVNAFQSSYGGGVFEPPDAFVAKILSAVGLSPQILVFVTQPNGTPVGTTTPAQTIALSNNGNSTLIISSLAFIGTNPSDFAETDNCIGSVLVGASCNINVTFTPTATGTRTGTLTITNNLTSSPLTALLSGMGITATLTASLSPSSLTFTSQTVGSTSAAQGITFGNTGNVALIISNLAITGTNASDFSETNNCGGSVAAGASCTINVTFAPTATGTLTGILAITDNAPGSPQTVKLVGNGEDFSISPSSSSSATVSPGQTANYSLAVAPAGGFNQSVSLTCSGAPAQSTCAVSPNPISLGGTSAITAMVTVTTTAASQGSVLPLGTGRPMSMKDRPTPLILGVLGTLVLVVVSLVLRRLEQRFRWAPIFALAVLVCLGTTMSSCGGNGGGGGNIGTQAGTYTIIVSGNSTSGAPTLTHTTNLTLIVQ